MQSSHSQARFAPPSGAPAQAGAYDRQRDLPLLLPLWPEDLAVTSIPALQSLVDLLHNVLRRERQRGLAGDWCYSLARHQQLLIAYRAERSLLDKVIPKKR